MEKHKRMRAEKKRMDKKRLFLRPDAVHHADYIKIKKGE